MPSEQERSERCETCRFVGPERVRIGSETVVFRQCRRYAPRPLGVHWTGGEDAILHDESRWPSVLPESWCGEWEPVPKPPDTLLFGIPIRERLGAEWCSKREGWYAGDELVMTAEEARVISAPSHPNAMQVIEKVRDRIARLQEEVPDA